MKLILLALSIMLAGCSLLKESPPAAPARVETPAIIAEQWDYFNVTSQNNEVVSPETIGQLQQLTQKLFHCYAMSVGTFDRATLEFADSDVVFDHQPFTVSGKITAIMQTPATTAIPTPVLWRPNSLGVMTDRSNPRISGVLRGHIEITRTGPPLEIILSPNNLLFGWSQDQTPMLTDIKNAFDQNYDYMHIIYHDESAPSTPGDL